MSSRLPFLYFTTTCLATTVWEVTFQDSGFGSHNLFNILASAIYRYIVPHVLGCIAILLHINILLQS